MERPRFRAYFLHPRFWPLWLGLGVLWLVVQLPYRLQLQLGRLLGWLMFRLAGPRRQIAERNLQLCFPGKSAAERERLLREEAERKAGNREAMKDPKKAAMFEMMAKNFPGIPVTFKKDSSWRDNIPTDAQTQL